MLKYKVIRAFVAVWCAVCLAYVGVRTAFGAVLDKTDQVEVASDAAEVEVASAPEAAETPAPEAEVSAASEAETAPEAAETPAPEEETVTSLDPEPTDESEAEPESEAESTGTTNDLLNESKDEPQETEVLEVPSLDEYLSWYTCGSCRRNCSLANPRCHNGSRLAQLKAQEYYELYG